MLRLSPFVLPQVRMGAVRISPLNMAEHPERVSYVEGLQAYLAYLLELLHAGAVERDEVEVFHQRAHLANLVAPIDWSGPRVTRWPHAADYVSFDLDRLGVMFLDGRLRNERDMVYLPTGASTPAFAKLVALLARGVDRKELAEVAIANEIELDDDFLALLVERGVVEDIATPTPIEARFAARPGDRVTWLGASAIVFQTGSTTVWVDPLVPPQIAYQPDELADAFSDRIINAEVVAPPYDPDCTQLTVRDLPPPDAVVLSHEDVNCFDLGLLMCLPATTPIVVPATRPQTPWQIDVGETITRVLGERPVIRIAHGETIAFGEITVGAVPFVGEWPASLPTDWNCYVIRGREGSAILCHFASILEEHLELIAAQLGDRAERAVMFALELYAGAQKYTYGFRESPAFVYPYTRQWPWYLPMANLFEPTPYHGICQDVLSSLGERTGLRRFSTYGFSGAPWLTFQMPHAHRYNLDRPPRALLARQRTVASAIGFELPAIRIGVPFPL